MAGDFSSDFSADFDVGVIAIAVPDAFTCEPAFVCITGSGDSFGLALIDRAGNPKSLATTDVVLIKIGRPPDDPILDLTSEDDTQVAIIELGDRLAGTGAEVAFAVTPAQSVSLTPALYELEVLVDSGNGPRCLMLGTFQIIKGMVSNDTPVSS